VNTGKENIMIGKIKILQSSNGQWFFRVVSTNGNTLCHSETYWNYTDCYSAAQIVQRGGGRCQVG